MEGGATVIFFCMEPAFKVAWHGMAYGIWHMIRQEGTHFVDGCAAPGERAGLACHGSVWYDSRVARIGEPYLAMDRLLCGRRWTRAHKARAREQTACVATGNGDTRVDRWMNG